MTHQQGFISIILIMVIVAALAGIFGYVALMQIPQYTVVTPAEKQPLPAPIPAPIPTPVPTPTPVPPPATKPDGKEIILREGQREGSLLVQKIYPTYITGLNYREYPLAMDQGQPITLYIGETASNGCTISLTLIKISGGTATFTEKTDYNRPCPICLAENTLINTPNGQITVQDLKEGMAAWTVDEKGNKVSATIIKTSKTPVPPTHQMVHIILDDGREVFASPGHPLTDGRVFNDLAAGDALNGSTIKTAEKTAYDKGCTYDILPSGGTGFYYANGILIGSTLK